MPVDLAPDLALDLLRSWSVGPTIPQRLLPSTSPRTEKNTAVRADEVDLAELVSHRVVVNSDRFDKDASYLIAVTFGHDNEILTHQGPLTKVADMSDGGGGQPPAGSPRSVRLIFEYDGDNVTLVSRQPVDIVPPPTDALDGFQGQQGFWAEVRGADGSVVHRQIMHNPIRTDAEVFSEDPSQTISRAPIQQPRGTFALLVPNIWEADHVALVSSPVLERSASVPAAEIGRFSLHERPASGATS